jgi:putative hydrolase of HD superfamily
LGLTGMCLCTFVALWSDTYKLCRGESISDHMYRMSLITMFAPPSLAARINIPHCTKMALVHDMAEALVGDITPVDGVPKDEKSRRESTTMDYFTKSLLGRVNGGMAGKDLKDIWQEYEDSETLESKFVHDVDKIELILQMFEYEKVQNGELDLGEFSWVASRIELPEVKEWAAEVMKEREDFWQKTGKQHTTYTDQNKPNAKQLEQHTEYYGNGSA